MTSPSDAAALTAAIAKLEGDDQATVATVQQQLTAAEAQVAQLQSQVRPGCLFGDTIRSTSGGVAEIDATYGPGKVLRHFSPKTLEAPLVTDRPEVGSWNVGTPTAAQVAPYRYVAYIHEVDSAIRKSATTLAAWQQQMATLVAELGGDKVCVILTAWCFETADPTVYLVPGVTHYAVDFDGQSPSKPTDTAYHDWTKALAAVTGFAAVHGLTWGVPEFGVNRGAFDPTGTARAAWLLTWALRFAAAGAQYVCLWEASSQAGSEFTSPAEIAAVRSLLGTTTMEIR